MPRLHMNAMLFLTTLMTGSSSFTTSCVLLTLSLLLSALVQGSPETNRSVSGGSCIPDAAVYAGCLSGRHCCISWSLDYICVPLQVCINFTDALGTSCGHADLSSAAVVHQIFTAERDQMLCHSLQHASLRHQQLPLQHPDCVLGVVGVAHIPGIIHCWEDGIGNSMAGVDTQFPGTDVHVTAVPLEDAEAQGVRRALLEAFLGLSCSSAVCADMQRHLPALPPEAEEAYACTRELYGSPRMLLAALPREHLNKVSHLRSRKCQWHVCTCFPAEAKDKPHVTTDCSSLPAY